jgi:hypothetical protein
MTIPTSTLIIVLLFKKWYSGLAAIYNLKTINYLQGIPSVSHPGVFPVAFKKRKSTVENPLFILR